MHINDIDPDYNERIKGGELWDDFKINEQRMIQTKHKTKICTMYRKIKRCLNASSSISSFWIRSNRHLLPME